MRIKFLVSPWVLIFWHSFLGVLKGRGTVATGRVEQGVIKPGDDVEILGLTQVKTILIWKSISSDVDFVLFFVILVVAGITLMLLIGGWLLILPIKPILLLRHQIYSDSSFYCWNSPRSLPLVYFPSLAQNRRAWISAFETRERVGTIDFKPSSSAPAKSGKLKLTPKRN